MAMVDKKQRHITDETIYLKEKTININFTESKVLEEKDKGNNKFSIVDIKNTNEKLFQSVLFSCKVNFLS